MTQLDLRYEQWIQLWLNFFIASAWLASLIPGAVSLIAGRVTARDLGSSSAARRKSAGRKIVRRRWKTSTKLETMKNRHRRRPRVYSRTRVSRANFACRRVGEISRHFPTKTMYLRSRASSKTLRERVPGLIPSPRSCWYPAPKTIRENGNGKNRGIVYYGISGTTMNLSWIWFTVLFRRVWQAWIYDRWRWFTSPILDIWYIARQVAASI